MIAERLAEIETQFVRMTSERIEDFSNYEAMAANGHTLTTPVRAALLDECIVAIILRTLENEHPENTSEEMLANARKVWQLVVLLVDLRYANKE